MIGSDETILPSQLCIGLHVHLDLGWTEHPFTFSSFKIKSLDPIATLQGLGLERIRSALSTLVKNLVENAVHYSAPGGVVTITVSAMSLAVRDDGPGVAPHDVPKLFTRFWRSEGAPHRGAGLGLSICQTIAGVHGWLLTYRDASPGPGAEFELRFRAARRPWPANGPRSGLAFATLRVHACVRAFAGTRPGPNLLEQDLTAPLLFLAVSRDREFGVR